MVRLPLISFATKVVLVLTSAPVAEATPWKTLDYLYSISGKQTVAGVHNKLSATPTSWTDQVVQTTGRVPGLWSGDFLFDEVNINNRWTMINEAKAQWGKGVLINIMWHVCNPAKSEPCNWNPGCDGNGPWSRMSDAEWNELITDDSRLNKIWKRKMDDIAQYLVYLKDNGVEVMFRPLHEMNQGCFWWGRRPGPQGTRRLYQITHDYLTNQKGLTNLIWVWNIQDFGSLRDDVNEYNPGSQYWEVASLDVYFSDGKGYEQWKYDVMVQVAGVKPIAIGECGRLPSLDQLSSQPRWTFFMSWSDELIDKGGTPVDEVRAVYGGNRVLTLDEMPGWNGNIPAPQTASFRSFHNTYLSAWNDGSIQLQPHAQDWEVWAVQQVGNGKVALKSFHNTFLSAWPDGSIQLMNHSQDWEQWTQLQNSDGSVSLRSYHGTYLSAWPDGSVRLAEHNQAWEHWRM